MNKMTTGVFQRSVFACLLLGLMTVTVGAQDNPFPWLSEGENLFTETIADIPVPRGYTRVDADPHSFVSWLRQLPIKSGENKVYLYNGKLKTNQKAHYKVLAIDVGERDLQQCADAIIRLRTEYLFSRQAHDQIAFNFTSGDRASFLQWADGYRPDVKGNKVIWSRRAQQTRSYQNFRAYLDTVFMYAGSYSLSQELRRVETLEQIRIGDVFIQGGFPGHAVLVVDMARSERPEKIAIMLAQSYMPAQEIHLLLNPKRFLRNPWYVVGETEQLHTPEWTFEWTDLKRFPEDRMATVIVPAGMAASP